MAGYRKLGRTSSQRKALLRIQATNLLYHGKIVTTEARAKEVRKCFDKMVTYGKNGSLGSRRLALAFLHNDEACVSKVFNELAPRYKDRNGGYTRIIKTTERKGDAALMVILELV